MKGGSIINSGTPQISMWVAPSGTYAQATDAWTWTGTAPRKSLGYNRAVKKGMAFQLCAEQFGSGSAVIGGRWTADLMSVRKMFVC